MKVFAVCAHLLLKSAAVSGSYTAGRASGCGVGRQPPHHDRGDDRRGPQEGSCAGHAGRRRHGRNGRHGLLGPRTLTGMQEGPGAVRGLFLCCHHVKFTSSTFRIEPPKAHGLSSENHGAARGIQPRPQVSRAHQEGLRAHSAIAVSLMSWRMHRGSGRRPLRRRTPRPISGWVTLRPRSCRASSTICRSASAGSLPASPPRPPGARAL